MGMVTPGIISTPEPKYQGTVVCKHCLAEYRPRRWDYGYYIGTTTQFVTIGSVDEEHCPICRKHR